MNLKAIKNRIRDWIGWYPSTLMYEHGDVPGKWLEEGLRNSEGKTNGVCRMDREKLTWLEANGYKPINDKIIRECLTWLYIHHPDEVQEREAEYRAKFSYYKRYGNQIMPYSKEYLERTSIEELKTKDRRNIWRFVIMEVRPIKQLVSMWYRFSLRYL